MKKIVTLFILLVVAIIVNAQDVIVKTDGSTILAKVLEVNESDVKYKKYTNKKGPTYTISKSKIMAINYENGDKDDFQQNNSNAEDHQLQSNGLVELNTPPDNRNSEILSAYSQDHDSEDKKNDKVAKNCWMTFSVSKKSVMSNKDIEISFVREKHCAEWTWITTGRDCYDIYLIKIKNKTSQTLYIDRGNCFRVINDGRNKCYYDISQQVTVNQGGGSGVSIGLGSVASAIGIGGAVGQIAGGVSVGGGSNYSTSTSHNIQRVVAIPPYGTSNLSDEIRVERKRSKYGDFINIDEAEIFGRGEMGLDKYRKRGVKVGETIRYTEIDSPWKCNYYITYSNKENFGSYSTVNVELYLHEIIGQKKNGFTNHTPQTLFWYFSLK